MKRRFKIYPDSSFWSRLAGPYDPRRRASFDFLRSVAVRHEILTSRLVIREIEGTPDRERRRALLRRIWGLRLRMVTLNSRIARMAREIRRAGRRGEGLIADVLHIAYAVFGQADALVTWDEDDLARERTRLVVQAYGRRVGLPTPMIGTPLEVAGWLGIRIR